MRGLPEGELGMRRVSWVRIVQDGDHCTCEAFGVGHRQPVRRRVSLSTAVVLAGRGVPVVVRNRRPVAV